MVAKNRSSSFLNVQELTEELRRIYAEKRRQKPTFSRRTFARSLGINDSTLRKVLSGERNLGPLIAQKIADRMGYVLNTAATPRKRDIPPRSAGHQVAFLEVLAQLMKECGHPEDVIQKVLEEDLEFKASLVKQALHAKNNHAEPFGEDCSSVEDFMKYLVNIRAG